MVLTGYRIRGAGVAATLVILAPFFPVLRYKLAACRSRGPAGWWPPAGGADIAATAVQAPCDSLAVRRHRQ